jgi:hypothetical protein
MVPQYMAMGTSVCCPTIPIYIHTTPTEYIHTALVPSLGLSLDRSKLQPFSWLNLKSHRLDVRGFEDDILEQTLKSEVGHD